MRTQHRFLIIIFILLVSSPAIASDWVEIGSSKSSTLYVDKQSIKGDMNSRKFWEQTVFKERQYEKDAGTYYTMTKEYVEVDCNNSTEQLYQITYYLDVEPVDMLSFFERRISKIVPDSIGESVKKYVCSFKQTK